MAYDAFISYSHAADGKLAPAVQHALHKLAKPWYRMRALKVFRDETSLSASHDLTDSIRNALSQARFFVLMASPEAARSTWVGREIELWRGRQLPTQLLIIQTEGEIVWDDAARDFDWSRSTALHPTLKGMFEKVPLWVDLRWARDEQHLSPRDARFQREIARIAAPIHGLNLDDMFGEDVRQHRNTMLVTRGAVAALLLLLVLSTTTTLVATRANDSLDRKLLLLNSLVPAFSSYSSRETPDSAFGALIERTWSTIERYLVLGDDEELIEWGPELRLLAEDCDPERNVMDAETLKKHGCPPSSAVFGADGLRADVPDLKEMSAAIVEAIRGGRLRDMLGEHVGRFKANANSPDTGEADKEAVDAVLGQVLRHAAMAIPARQREELAELSSSAGLPWPEEEPARASLRHARTWKKRLRGAELIAMHLVDSADCGSRGCASPTLFILRVGQRYRLVLAEYEADRFAVYGDGSGAMPQIFTIDIKQSGAGNQFRRFRRYDFDNAVGHYQSYFSGSSGSTAPNFDSTIPDRLD